jgi:hypothetical protein
MNITAFMLPVALRALIGINFIGRAPAARYW